MRKDGFTFLLFGILQFHIGRRLTPVAKGYRGLFDVSRVLTALERGAVCRADLSHGYDLFANKDRPLDEVRRDSIPWLAIDLAPGLVWAPIRNVAIGLTVEPWVALVRRRFEIDNQGVIWRPLPVGVRVLVGIEARF